jgi:cellobiose-specific phosphotransferase system component IIC
MYVNSTLKAVLPFLMSSSIVFIAITDFYYFKEMGTNGNSISDNYKFPMMYAKQLSIQYQALFFAEFSDSIFDDYDYIDFTMFVISMVVTLIVLLNLLISIISDSHEKINQNLKKSEGLILCQLIKELETLPGLALFYRCNRKKDK